MSAPFVAIFDFDHSLIDENSDTFIFEKKDAEIIAHMHKRRTDSNAEGAVWTDLMDECLGLYHARGRTRADMAATFANTPIFAEWKHLLERLHNSKTDMFIVSDANSHFISEIISAHNIAHYFQHNDDTNNSVSTPHNSAANDVSIVSTNRRIYTNPASFDESGRLRVSYFDVDASNCPNCPRNMCKGRVMDSIQRHYDNSAVTTNTAQTRFLYVGDGTGDYCPMSRMRATDIAAVRRAFPLDKLISARGGISAQIMNWSDGKDMTEIVQHFLNTNPSAATR